MKKIFSILKQVAAFLFIELVLLVLFLAIPKGEMANGYPDDGEAYLVDPSLDCWA